MVVDTNNINLFFKNLPIFYINLDKSKDRNNYILESFKKNNIDLYFRVPAIDGNKLKKEYSHYNLTQSEVALFFSFKKALEMFLETQHEYCAIVEDDIDLDNSKNINFNFYETLKYHDPLEYVLQCAPTIQNTKYLSLKIKKRTPHKKEKLWGTPMMIINRVFAEKIIKEVFYDEDIHPCGPSDWQKQLDYCIYSHADTHVWTIFTIKDFESTISKNNSDLIKKSINNINSFLKEKEIYLHDVFD